MPKKSNATNNQKVDYLRHNEYYGMQEVFDNLYASSSNGMVFENLMDTVLMEENIMLAYRNLKQNDGSNTPGTDGKTIRDIACLPAEEVVEKVRYYVCGSKHGYRPKLVRRKDIPKANGKTRPLGIPCIWDRLIQQCIKQVLEPICEAKFSENSYGFRPNRSVENAIAAIYKHMQKSNLHYVVEFDIKSFFDNVNHSKLIKQIWAMGIHDKHLIWVIKQILKAPIRLENGTVEFPNKGTPQGGIISPLLANIVLNELDQWVDSQWQDHPVSKKFTKIDKRNGSLIRSDGYRAMRTTTTLKEMHIVRYADDFRILCRTKNQAALIRIAVTKWLDERLKLEISQEKTRIVNVKRKYSDFLGFKIKVRKKGSHQVVHSHVNDKALKSVEEMLVVQAKYIAKPRKGRTVRDEVFLYNAKVLGVQEYYKWATCVNLDFNDINRRVMNIFTNRLQTQRGQLLCKTGGTLTLKEKERYGNTAMLRFVKGIESPIYPIGYVQCANPMMKRRDTSIYTAHGRESLHRNLRINIKLLIKIMKTPVYNQSIEYVDNRLSLFSAQWGKCAITGKEFRIPEDVHCHHKVPRNMGGGDEYSNLILILEPVHKLIHADREETVDKYLKMLDLSKSQLEKVNELRKLAGKEEI